MNVRTKIAVSLALSTVMVSRPFREQWMILSWILMCVPFIWMIALKRYSMAVKYLAVFTVVHIVRLPLFASVNNYLPSIVLMLFSILRHMLPGFGMAAIVMMTTSISSYLNAMSRMRLPMVLTIATSVVFRFVPTIREEYRGIKSAIKMRGLGGAHAIANPVQSFNMRMMPLLNCCARIGEELSMASLCRGLSFKSPRSMRDEDRLKLADWLMITGAAAILILWGITILFPSVKEGVLSSPPGV